MIAREPEARGGRQHEAEDCLLDALLGLAWNTRGEGGALDLDQVIALAQGGYGWGHDESGKPLPTDLDYAFRGEDDGYTVRLLKDHGDDADAAAADPAYRCVRDYECFCALCPELEDKEAACVAVVRRLEVLRDRIAGVCPGAHVRVVSGD